MKKHWLVLVWIIFALAFFSSVRIMALYWYHINMTRGDYDLAMCIMDKANTFNLSSYITGGLHFSVVIVIIMILLERG